MGFFFFATWVALGAVLLVAALLLRRGTQRSDARVVLRLPLEPRRTIYVVDIAGRHLVLGGSEAGIAMLAELDAAAVQRLATEPAPPVTLPALLWKRA